MVLKYHKFVLMLWLRWGLDIIWDEQFAGLSAVEQGLELLNSDVLKSIQSNAVCLKAPLTTPIGEGFKCERSIA